MTASSSESAWLVLADGTVFSGLPCGAGGSVVGEVVFNTGMTGYQEVMTDPSYSGQLVTFTYRNWETQASIPMIRRQISRMLKV